MACFLVPAAEAVITTAVYYGMKSKEINPKLMNVKYDKNQFNHDEKSEETEKVPFTKKLKWLNNMLWGGSALLAFEHVWHGEVVPWFPFLTNAANPADAAEMLHEMSTAGVSMAVIVSLVWLGMVAVSSAIEKRAPKVQPSEG
ncbi:MAG: hypothetical protein ACI4U1_02725 [Anaerovoracaceae bacterium]